MTDEQVEAILGVLNKHRVKYIVIGGIASQLHGAPTERSRDTDVVVRRSRPNLVRLCAALDELGARLRVQGGALDGVEVDLAPPLFDRMQTITFVTRHGPLDVCFRPDGTEGYDDLIRDASAQGIGGETVPTASLEDIIRSKTAAGRAKDLSMLPILSRYLRQLRRGTDT
jgi:hypothetical protein